MAKEILVLTGSPRKDGNSDMLADALIKGASAKGHQVTKFSTGNKKISGCIACDTCWSKGRACSIKDDFTELEPLLEKADVLVFATPLYWFGVSAQLKAAIDRLYAYVRESPAKPLKIQESALLICGADEDASVFSGAIGTYKNMLKYLGWLDAGILTVTEVQNKGDVLETGALAKAEELGASL